MIQVTVPIHIFSFAAYSHLHSLCLYTVFKAINQMTNDQNTQEMVCRDIWYWCTFLWGNKIIIVNIYQHLNPGWPNLSRLRVIDMWLEASSGYTVPNDIPSPYLLCKLGRLRCFQSTGKSPPVKVSKLFTVNVLRFQPRGGSVSLCGRC